LESPRLAADDYRDVDREFDSRAEGVPA